jgi:hypothetical protein
LAPILPLEHAAGFGANESAGGGAEKSVTGNRHCSDAAHGSAHDLLGGGHFVRGHFVCGLTKLIFNGIDTVDWFRLTCFCALGFCLCYLCYLCYLHVWR